MRRAGKKRELLLELKGSDGKPSPSAPFPFFISPATYFLHIASHLFCAYRQPLICFSLITVAVNLNCRWREIEKKYFCVQKHSVVTCILWIVVYLILIYVFNHLFLRFLFFSFLFVPKNISTGRFAVCLRLSHRGRPWRRSCFSIYWNNEMIFTGIMKWFLLE